MDRATLMTLKRMVRPLTLSGALTLERASSVASLNCEVARFHAAVCQAERMLDVSGGLDEGIAQELLARALQLARLREGMALAHARRAQDHQAALGTAAPPDPSAGAEA